MDEWGELTGRRYKLIDEYKCEDADTVFVSLGCAAENIEEACDYLRDQRNAKVGSIHINVIRPFPEKRRHRSAAWQERTSSSSSAPTRAWRATTRSGATSAPRSTRRSRSTSTAKGSVPALVSRRDPAPVSTARTASARATSVPEHTLGAYEFATGSDPTQGRPDRSRRRDVFHARNRSPLLGDFEGHAVAASSRAPSRCASTRSVVGA